MSKKYCVVITTCASKREAVKIAGSVLKKRFAACANILPHIESRFWWRGKVDKSREVLVIFKTVSKNYKYIAQEIKRFHSYEVPEIIALPVVIGDDRYLKWIDQSVS